MRRTPIILAAAAALAGCGGEPAADPADARRDAALEYASCMREHGVDIPDPAPDESGRVTLGGAVTKSDIPIDTFEKAEEECRSELEAIAPPDLPPEQQREMREAALAHARCLREHGIDFPDPTFGEDGGATVRFGKGAVDPGDPRFQKAQEACRSELPELQP